MSFSEYHHSRGHDRSRPSRTSSDVQPSTLSIENVSRELPGPAELRQSNNARMESESQDIPDVFEWMQPAEYQAALRLQKQMDEGDDCCLNLKKSDQGSVSRPKLAARVNDESRRGRTDDKIKRKAAPRQAATAPGVVAVDGPPDRHSPRQVCMSQQHSVANQRGISDERGPNFLPTGYDRRANKKLQSTRPKKRTPSHNETEVHENVGKSSARMLQLSGHESVTPPGAISVPGQAQPEPSERSGQIEEDPTMLLSAVVVTDEPESTASPTPQPIELPYATATVVPSKQRKRKLRLVLVLLTVALVGIVLGFVFGFRSHKASQDEIVLTLVVKLDSNPEETGLTLDCSSKHIVSLPSGTFREPNAVVRRKVQIRSGDVCILSVTDAEGNGIDGGYAEVYLGQDTGDRANRLLQIPGSFTDKASRTFTARPGPIPGPTPIPTFDPTPGSTQEPSPVSTLSPAPGVTTEPTKGPTIEPIPTPMPDLPDTTPEPTEPVSTPEPTRASTPRPTQESTPGPTLPDRTQEPTPIPSLNATPDPTLEPTPAPTREPTQEPTPAQSRQIRDLIVSATLDGGASLQDSSSPQSKALSWLEGNKDLDDYTDEQVIQRYVLATFYHSTNGMDWKESDGWLTDHNECDWHSAPCNREQTKSLFLSTNDLRGEIPPELALLSNSLEDLAIQNNEISGTIPTELGLFEKINELRLSRNQLSGTIPTEIENLSTMTRFAASGMNLDGTIPDIFQSLTNLHDLHIYENNFTGELRARTPLNAVSFHALTARTRTLHVVPFEEKKAIPAAHFTFTTRKPLRALSGNLASLKRSLFFLLLCTATP